MPSRTILITGASDGIGAAAARQLSAEGHRLLITGRSATKIAAVATDCGAEAFVADFGDFADVRRLAAQIHEALDGNGLDVLANNAGGIFGDTATTVDGLDKTLQVNHLSPFLLTTLLLPDLLADGGGSVINTSSVGNRLFGNIDINDLNNEKSPHANKKYGDAKLANILFTRELHARYHDAGLSSVAFHPGNVATNFASDTTSILRFVYRTPLKRLGLISPAQGGSHLAWLIEGTPDTTWQSGAYYDKRKLSTKVNPQVTDDTLARALWSASAELVTVSPR